MRRSLRDWIAWTLLASIIIVTGTEWYIQRTAGMSTAQYVYKIVVTADRPGN